MEVTRVLGGIYMGGFTPLANHTPLKAEYNITHILSVIKLDTIPEYLVRKGYTLKSIPIDDDDTTDILQYFNESNKFLDHCLYPYEQEYDPALVDFQKKKQDPQNAVYVHCQAGISRSTSFVVAYLMYRFGLRLKDALHAVRRKRPQVEPNPNFMEQLQVYAEMGANRVDPDNQLYKTWKLAQSIKVDPTGRDILSKDDTYKDSSNEDQELDKLTKEELSQTTVIRCKNCRKRLALSTSFIKHDPPSKQSSEGHFIRRAAGSRRIIDIQESSTTCSHFFVEPLNWMKQELQGKQELEGKFSCPGCSYKVGGYNWKGSRCSCGKWVIPAIHLQSSKVDHFPLAERTLPNMVNFKPSNVPLPKN